MSEEFEGADLDPDERALAKCYCVATFELNADRVAHFKNQLAECGLTADEFVIVVINFTDVHGGPLAKELMPGTDWQKILDQDELPFARGLAEKEVIQECLELFDQEEAAILRRMTDVAVVVIDHKIAKVFPA